MIPKQIKNPKFPDCLSGFSVSNSKACLFTFHAKYTVIQVHKTIINTNPISSPNHPKLPIRSITIIGVMLSAVLITVYCGFCNWSVRFAFFIQERMIVVEAFVVGLGFDCRGPWNLSEVLRPEFIARPLFVLGCQAGSREQRWDRCHCHRPRRSPTRRTHLIVRQLCEPVLDHHPTHIGKAEIAALETVGQLFVLQTETVEHGRMEVVDVDRFVLDAPS